MFHVKQFSEKTIQNLKKYENLLQKWQKKINLVSTQTLTDVWNRHFLDSAQLWEYISKGAETLVDFGSGAGFPGLVLAIIADGEGCQLDVHLIESDGRKCVFLSEVARSCGVSVHIHNERIEKTTPFTADVVTARALKDTKTLLEYVRPFVSEKTTALFLKGEKVREEWQEASKSVSAQPEFIQSQTDKTGTILKLSSINYL
ncbi:MAG: 16S rRNA (guanine(527)-N(7))-methyltransferase RsmG [Alphaproteobacteria bacterium]|nr:16S rRNA (guanine(527)-N(7))-methyltransferase RsmG [Alphaproteobacteria bacterium]